MDFSIMFWGAAAQRPTPVDQYKLVLEATQFADQHGFKAVWIPERHFHPWGGLFPNPSVICAALAATTKQIRLRAGSVVAPLHHALRIAEEWAVVDNLSHGRVEVAMATGWKDDDFALAPHNYETRRSIHVETIQTVQALWRGEKYAAKNGSGQPIEVTTYPTPIQPELPIWVTSAGSLKSISRAGRAGFNLLTHLLGQDYDELAKKISQYHAYRVSGGFKSSGQISLMMHTFLGHETETVRELVRSSLCEYLIQSADLAIPTALKAQWDEAEAELKKTMIDQAFDRYFDTAALMGTPASCAQLVSKLKKMGVTDICCLIDFGMPPEQVLGSLKLLAQLKDQFSGD